MKAGTSRPRRPSACSPPSRLPGRATARRRPTRRRHRRPGDGDPARPRPRASRRRAPASVGPTRRRSRRRAPPSPSSRQSSPARTGGAGADGLPTVVSDTPNCAPSATPRSTAPARPSRRGHCEEHLADARARPVDLDPAAVFLPGRGLGKAGGDDDELLGRRREEQVARASSPAVEARATRCVSGSAVMSMVARVTASRPSTGGPGGQSIVDAGADERVVATTERGRRRRPRRSAAARARDRPARRAAPARRRPEAGASPGPRPSAACRSARRP